VTIGKILNLIDKEHRNHDGDLLFATYAR